MLLIIGGNSKIARFLQPLFNKNHLLLTDKKGSLDYELDLENLGKINFDKRISHAVVLASITNIEYCNDNESIARKINGDNTIKLIKELNRKGIKVLFPSSTCVFSSKSKRNNYELSPTNADTIYGKIKAQVEKDIIKNKLNTVLRISKIICPDDKLLKDWKFSLINKKRISAFYDLRLAPTSVYSVGKFISNWYNSPWNGIVHLSPAKDISYLELAQKLCSYLLIDKSFVNSESTENSSKKVIYKPLKSYLSCKSPISKKLDLDNEIEKIFKSLY